MTPEEHITGFVTGNRRLGRSGNHKGNDMSASDVKKLAIEYAQDQVKAVQNINEKTRQFKYAIKDFEAGWYAAKKYFEGTTKEPA